MPVRIDRRSLITVVRDRPEIRHLCSTVIYRLDHRGAVPASVALGALHGDLGG
jgi:hypothetical protein